MTDIQLINSFIARKQEYVDLKIGNIFAAHLIALSTRFPRHKELIVKALNPNDVAIKTFAPSKFVNTTPHSVKKHDTFGVCPDCPQPAGTASKPESKEKEQVFKTVADIQLLYPTRDDLVRAAIQLNLNPHHKSSEAKIAADILKALND